MATQETFQNKPVYALSEITKSIENIIAKNYNRSYYIKAEILKLNYYPHSGHCYPELAERENHKIKAQLRGIIWSTQFNSINKRFVAITGEPLKENITVLCLATIEFSGQYGLSLQIQDIEPLFTLGEMERNKREVIEKLKKEQIFLMNKQKTLPLLPQRVAVISVETSKGYNDFMVILQQNSALYKFQCILFPSILQGDKALVSIPSRFAEISRRQQEFDCVVLVRGGGGDAGISCYDHYDLAAAVATCPLPVITGIGHSTNETVTDMVAFANKITPTEVAYFLIQQFQNFLLQVDECKHKLIKQVQKLLQEKEFYFSNTYQQLLLNIAKYKQYKEKEIQMVAQYLQTLVLQMLIKEQHNIQNFSTKIELLNPDNILRRGYSITMKNGKPLCSADDVTEGELIVTKLLYGEIASVVKKPDTF